MSLTLIAILSLAPALQDNTLTEEEKADGWKLLFDGKTLDGWRATRRTSPAPAGRWSTASSPCQGGGDI